MSEAQMNGNLLPEIITGLITFVASVLASVFAYPQIRRWLGTFKPVVGLGNPILRAVEDGELFLQLSLNASNAGGREGWIQDLVAAVMLPTSHDHAMLFYPIAAIDAGKEAELRNKQNLPTNDSHVTNETEALATQERSAVNTPGTQAFKSFFVPFRIESSAHFEETFLFGQKPPEGSAPMRSGDLEVGTYEIKLYVGKSTDGKLPEYEKVASMEFKLTDREINLLKQFPGIAVRDEVLDVARQELLDKLTNVTKLPDSQTSSLRSARSSKKSN